MAWIPIRHDLCRDPAVILVARLLDMDEDHVVGKLVKLWSWASEVSRDGNAPSVTNVWIDRYLSTPGFSSALEKAGWLVISDAGVSFPKFDRWLCNSAKKRLLGAKRVRDWRNANVTQPALQKRYHSIVEDSIEDKTPSSVPPEVAQEPEPKPTDLLMEELVLTLGIGWPKAREIVEVIGVTRNDWNAWQVYRAEHGHRLAVMHIQRYRNPSMIPGANEKINKVSLDDEIARAIKRGN